MANEIYKVSLWGFSSSTGFGSIYYNLKNQDPLASGYESRVKADGGIIESLSCLSSLGLNSYNWNYNYRVQNDGGVVESLACVPLY